MSPRAACRLESLGLAPVYDYAPGKADWTAASLPTEGAQAAVGKVGGRARRDVPRCRLDEAAGDVLARMGGWEAAVVVGDGDIVLGLAPRDALASAPHERIDAVMSEGPATFRPDLAAAEMGAHLRTRRVAHALVTTSDGALIGLLRAEDVHEHETSES